MDSPRESSSGSNPTSALLQDMIKEKRAQTQRVSKIRDTSGRLPRHELDTRDVQSSPLNGTSSKDRPSIQARKSSGKTTKAPPAPKEMGLREMQEHISKINKQNFDLKLEVFHRRQRSEVLESKVEKLEGLDAENEELRAVNDDLVLQVKKRDADIDMREAAIEEAVGMICDLEARIDDLQQILDPRPKKENMITSSSYRVKLEPPSTPPQAKQETIMNGYSATHIAKADALPSIPSRSPLRQPTFLKEGKRSTAALRSLYSSGNPSFASLKRPSSIFSDEEFDEEMEQQMLNSPRLSILSESGFSSIYGHTREQTATPLQPTSPNIPSAKASNGPAQRAAQREARICDWVEESNQQERPKTPSRQALHAAASCHFSSINEVLEKVPNLPTSQATRSPSSPKSTSSSAKQRSENAYVEQRSPTKSLRKSARAHERLPSRGSSVFGTNRLPPTPDTMSTATIGGTSSTQSIITEKSLADGRVVPPNGYTALLQDGRAHSYKQLGFGRKLASSDHAGFETSDEELESTRAERSDLGSRGNDVGYAESPLFVGGSMKATRFFGSNTPARPALTTHATDVMFNNEGLSPKPPSRGLSYPSPTGTNRRISSQLSPSSKRSSGVPSERTVTSPRPSSPSQVRSSSPLQTKSNDRDAQAELDSKISRNSSSLRFRLPRLSSTSNSTQSQSVTSRIFRRTNSQSSNNLETGEDVTARIRPLQRPRIPRPSSHYGTRPGTSDGTNVSNASTSSRERQSMAMRRYSAVLDDDPVGMGKSIDAEPRVRRASESRQDFRTTDEGRMRGLGRTASAKIREGLGLKR